MAARFLQRRGARVLGSNLRSGPGEVDLLVAFGATVVAVEVKTRIGGDPMLGFTADKERSFAAAARALRHRPHRRDVVTVRLDDAGATIRWLRDV